MAEADAEKRPHLIGRQLEQLVLSFGPFGMRLEGFAQVVQRGDAVGGGAKGDGAGVAHALVPVVRQNERRRLRHRIDVSRLRLLIVIRRIAARRLLRLPQRGRVPQRAEPIQPARHIFLCKHQRVLSGIAVRIEQDQLTRSHAVDL